MAATEKRYVNLYVTGKGIAGTYNELRKHATKLRAELNGAKLTQEEFNKKVLELRSTEGAMRAHRESIRKTSNSWSMLKSVAMGVIGGNLLLKGFQAITNFIPNMVRRNAELADSFADVQRITKFTDTEMRHLNASLRAIDTRTPRKRMLEMARDAGKLGIQGVENITGFVKAADQINVALGEDLGADAIKNLGKLNNLFKVSDIYGYEKGMLKLGSVINDLGDSSEAAEANIVDFTSRLAGVGEQANISFQDIAAYGATLDSLGQRVETSGTAVSQAIVRMFKDTPTYAKIAGKSVDEFSKLLKTNANEAFIQFLEGLNGNNAGLAELTQKFDQLGLNGSRAITVMAALSANTGRLREQQAMANKTFEEGTSITNAFQIKNLNAAGALEKLGKRLAGVWINSKLLNAMGSVVSWLERITRAAPDKEIHRQRIATMALITETMKLNTHSADRLKNIRQLKKEYPGLTSHITGETASNEDLLNVLREVNSEYLRKALLARKESVLGDMSQDIAKAAFAADAALETVNAVREDILKGVNEKSQLVFRQYEDQIVGFYRKVQAARGTAARKAMKMDEYLQKHGMLGLTSTDISRFSNRLKEYEALKEKQIAAEKKFQDQMDEINRISNRSKTGTGGLGTADPTVVEDEVELELTDKEQDAIKKRLEAIRETIRKEKLKLDNDLLEDHERELAITNEHYDELVRRAEGFSAEIQEIEELRRRAIEEIERKHQENMQKEREETELRIHELLNPDSRHAEIIALEKKYDEMIALAVKYKIDVTELTIAKNKAILALEEEHQKAITKLEREQFEERLDAYNDYVGQVVEGMQHAAYVMGGESARTAKHQQKLGLISLGVSTGVAMAKQIEHAALLPPPLSFFAMAASIGKLLAFIAQAKKAFSNDDIPAYALGSTNTFIAGDQGREIIDGNRVIPADITQRILAANAFNASTPQPNFSAINDGLTYTQGRQAEQSSVQPVASGIDMTVMVSEMRAMRAALIQNRKVVLSQFDFNRFQDDYKRNESRVVMRKN